MNYDLVLMFEYSKDSIEHMNRLCRNHQPNIGFISAEVWGLTGCVFVDFGDYFLLKDPDRIYKEVRIKDISQSKPGIIKLYPSKTSFKNNDTVTFYKVNGMSELNYKDFEIFDVQTDSFSIEDTSLFSPYLEGGEVQLKYSTILHTSYSNSLLNPRVIHPFYSHSWQHLHLSYLAIKEFQVRHGYLPRLRNLSDSSECVKIAADMTGLLPDLFSRSEVNYDTVRTIASTCRAQLAPMTSIIGGVIGMEIIKHVGKYLPINQWLYFDYSEITKEVAETDIGECIYKDQIAIFGKEVQEKIKRVNTFVIGAGALGCEFMKLVALMGVGENGMVSITDDDLIEESNLNRRFLYIQDSIGLHKSQCAAEATTRINSSYCFSNLTYYNLRLNQDTEHIFNDTFWSGLNCVFMALDNYQSREYVDNKCVWYNLPLFDSGTRGHEATSQVILPYITETYTDYTTDLTESTHLQNSCTAKTVLRTIEDCTIWSRDKFTEYFSTLIEQFNSVDEILNHSDKSERYFKHLDILIMNPRIEIYAYVAKEIFKDYFITSALDVIYIIHREYSIQDIPIPLEFNQNNEFHLQFVYLCAKMLARALGLYFTYGIDELRFELVYLDSEIEIPHSFDINRTTAKPIQFNKDDLDIIQFIHITANLKSMNFNIESNIQLHETQTIAGDIMPAISCTAAFITGVTMMEFYKLILDSPENCYRNTNCNLAYNKYSFVKTSPAKVITSCVDYPDEVEVTYPKQFTKWDKITVHSCSLKEFMNIIRERYRLNVSSICIDCCMIYPYEEEEYKENELLEEIYSKISRRSLDKMNYLPLVCISETIDTRQEVKLPIIRYKITNS